MKTIAYLSYLSLICSSRPILNVPIIGNRANNGTKYRVERPRFNFPTLAQVKSWIKHVPTYIMSTTNNTPKRVFLLNLILFGYANRIDAKNPSNVATIR